MKMAELKGQVFEQLSEEHMEEGLVEISDDELYMVAGGWICEPGTIIIPK
jgi:hypothetical protein